jgi:NhaA family Na+:H+ antiporter
VHATIAGVALGLLTPTGIVGGRNVLELLEHRLHTVSAFAIVPLFALANAGVSLGANSLTDAATSRVAWAIGRRARPG